MIRNVDGAEWEAKSLTEWKLVGWELWVGWRYGSWAYWLDQTTRFGKAGYRSREEAMRWGIIRLNDLVTEHERLNGWR